MPGRTHHTAIPVVPPKEVWEPIQAIRRRHDTGASSTKGQVLPKPCTR
jgi:hypothetical protein